MINERFYLMNVEDPLHEYGRWCKPVLEDGETGKQYENALEVMDLLNKYDEDCKMYRKDALKAEKDKETLLEENEKLKVRINTFIEGNRTLQARLKEVSIENKNTKAVLEDFMDILNKIQVNPTDEKLLNIARDMLQNMGVIE